VVVVWPKPGDENNNATATEIRNADVVRRRATRAVSVMAVIPEADANDTPSRQNVKQI
jgi:hypothetical protein